MAKLKLHVTSPSAWKGTLLKAEVVDQDLRVVHETVVPSGQAEEVEVDPGTYLTRIRLPSGQTDHKTVRVSSDDPAEAILKFDPGAGKGARKRSPFQAEGRLAELGEDSGLDSLYILAWLKGAEYLEVETDDELSRDADSGWTGFRLKREHDLQPGFLQAAGKKSPSRISALPPSKESLLLMQKQKQSKNVTVHVGSCDPVVNGLLGYVKCGDLKSAYAVSAHLFSKWDDLTTKTSPTVGYSVSDSESLTYERVLVALLSFHLSEHRDTTSKWTAFAQKENEWSPDAKILASWHLLTEEDDVKNSSTGFLDALELGTPIYTESVRLLYDGLSLCRQRCDKEGFGKLGRAVESTRTLTRAVDWSRSMTSFFGIAPDYPTEKPYLSYPIPSKVSLGALGKGSARIPANQIDSVKPKTLVKLVPEAQPEVESLRERPVCPPLHKRFRQREVILLAAILLVAIGLWSLQPWHRLPQFFRPSGLPIVAAGTPSVLVAPPGKGCPTWFADTLNQAMPVGNKIRIKPQSNDFNSPIAEAPLLSSHSLKLDQAARIWRIDYALFSECRSEFDGTILINLDLKDLLAEEGGSNSAVLSTLPGDVHDVMLRSVSEVRKVLNIEPLTSDEELILRNRLPGDEDFWLNYSQGRSALRMDRAKEALRYLNDALKLDPESPLVNVLISEAWSLLGIEERARFYASQAQEHSHILNRENQYLVNARYHEMKYQWDRAAEIYRKLWSLQPDEFEYGLKLVNVQVREQRGADALETIDSRLLEGLPGDPRVAILEAEASELVSNLRRGDGAAERAVQQSQVLGEKLLEAKAWLLWARLAKTAEEATSRIEEAASIYESKSHEAGQAASLIALGAVAGRTRRIEEAKVYFARASKILDSLDDVYGQAKILMNEGNVYSSQNDIDSALTKYQEALNLFETKLSNPRGKALMLMNFAILRQDRGELGTARTLYVDAVSTFQKIENLSDEALARFNLGTLLLEQGKLDQAEKEFTRASTLRKEVGNVGRQMALPRLAIGTIRLKRGEFEAAEELFSEARVYAPDDEDVTLSFATLHLERGEFDDAINLASAVERRLARLGASYDQVQVCILLAQTYVRAGDVEKAVEVSRRAQSLLKESGAPLLRLKADVAAAEVLAAAGDADSARRILQASLAQAKRLELPPVVLEASLVLGQLEWKAGNAGAAEEILSTTVEAATLEGFYVIASRAGETLSEISESGR